MKFILSTADLLNHVGPLPFTLLMQREGKGMTSIFNVSIQIRTNLKNAGTPCSAFAS
jgi:hypothetical protein